MTIHHRAHDALNRRAWRDPWKPGSGAAQRDEWFVPLNDAKRILDVYIEEAEKEGFDRACAEVELVLGNFLTRIVHRIRYGKEEDHE